MTKTQQKNEDAIKLLEERFNNLMTLFRAKNDSREFKKKQLVMISELKHSMNSVHQRLQPDQSGPFRW